MKTKAGIPDNWVPVFLLGVFTSVHRTITFFVISESAHVTAYVIY